MHLTFRGHSQDLLSGGGQLLDQIFWYQLCCAKGVESGEGWPPFPEDVWTFAFKMVHFGMVTCRSSRPCMNTATIRHPRLAQVVIVWQCWARETVVVVAINSLINGPKIPKVFLIRSRAQWNFASLHTHSCWHCPQIYHLRFFTYFPINE